MCAALVVREPRVESTLDRPQFTFSTSPFCVCVRRMDGREVSVYQALERTKGRAKGEDGRAKSGRLEKRPLILFE